MVIVSHASLLVGLDKALIRSKAELYLFLYFFKYMFFSGFSFPCVFIR